MICVRVVTRNEINDRTTRFRFSVNSSPQIVPLSRPVLRCSINNNNNNNNSGGNNNSNNNNSNSISISIINVICNM